MSAEKLNQSRDKGGGNLVTDLVVCAIAFGMCIPSRNLVKRAKVTAIRLVTKTSFWPTWACLPCIMKENYFRVCTATEYFLVEGV